MGPTQDNWRHQALIDLEDDFHRAHGRVRDELNQEKQERRNLEIKVERLVDELRRELKSEYQRKDLFESAFGPVQRGFYATVGLITTTVVLSILYIVLKH